MACPTCGGTGVVYPVQFVSPGEALRTTPCPAPDCPHAPMPKTIRGVKVVNIPDQDPAQVRFPGESSE